MFRRGMAIVVLGATLTGVSTGSAWARPEWKQRIDRAISGHSFGIMVREGGQVIYNHDGRTRRTPASNEKVLTSMLAYKLLGPRYRSSTFVRAHRRARTIRGNLFLVGRGDPAVASPGHYARRLPFRPTRLRALAEKIKNAGVRRIRGRVLGTTGYYKHDWWAYGWHRDFPRTEVALPSALAVDQNAVKGRHIHHPERRAAADLTKQLERIGVRVHGRPGAKSAPRGLKTVARSRSQPLSVLLRYTDRNSVNWYAEMFAKRIGLARFGGPGTIAKGARAIRSFTAARGVGVNAYDGSGLSFKDRISPAGLVTLLAWATERPWGPTFKRGLAGGGQGTLKYRLRDVRVRAKTGTLAWVSALSGYVWLKRDGRWAEFSILDSGMYKSTAIDIEDHVVRILTNYAHRA